MVDGLSGIGNGINTMASEISEALIRALEAGNYNAAPSKLRQGSLHLAPKADGSEYTEHEINLHYALANLQGAATTACMRLDNVLKMLEARNIRPTNDLYKRVQETRETLESAIIAHHEN
jgi:sulfopyruvate decarboxylase TPP-binding subunit